MRIALAQVNTTVGDLRGNARKIIEFISRAQALQADLVAFPELAVCGYPPEDLLMKEHFIQDNRKALQSIVKSTRGITAVVGFVDRDAEGIYNAAAVISEGKVKGIYHKKELPNYGVFDEKRYFLAGKADVLFSQNGILWAVNVCEDIWTDQGPYRHQAQAGAQVLINISSSPYHVGKIRTRETMLKSRAKAAKTFVCYVNLVGGQDELVFDGGSSVIDPRGKVIARAKQFEEDLIVVDLPLKSRAKTVSKKIKTIAIPALQKEDPVSIKRQLTIPFAKMEEIYRALVLGTRDYVLKNGFKKVVIGLSGGIDSCLTALIARDAIGAENVVGVWMPSKYSSGGTAQDARQLAENLKIRLIEVPIQDIFNGYLKTLEKEFTGQKWDTTEENLQARIRGNILMAFSNKFGWLVLTTGNKSEVAVGYCTLYGDMAGGFAVIKDVPKTTVYELARFRNAQNAQPLIPEDVFTRPPTAELRENQKDEDSLPPYEVLDRILKGYVELDKGLSRLNKEAPHDLIVKVIEMVDKNEYKRRQAPPGIKITPKAFGKDRRLPLTNRYKEY